MELKIIQFLALALDRQKTVKKMQITYIYIYINFRCTRMYVCAHVSTYLSFCWHSLRPLDTTPRGPRGVVVLMRHWQSGWDCFDYYIKMYNYIHMITYVCPLFLHKYIHPELHINYIYKTVCLYTYVYIYIYNFVYIYIYNFVYIYI